MKTNKNEAIPKQIILKQIIPEQIIPTNNSMKMDTITLAPTSPTQFESINNMPSLESTNINTIYVQPTPTTSSKNHLNQNVDLK